jgi:hypothetical protein
MGHRRGLPENGRHRAIGMLEGRMTVNNVAVSFDVHRTTIWRLAQPFPTNGTVKHRPKSGRPKRLTPREERYIRITAGRGRFLQELSTEYGEQLVSVYPRKQSTKNIKKTT